MLSRLNVDVFVDGRNIPVDLLYFSLSLSLFFYLDWQEIKVGPIFYSANIVLESFCIIRMRMENTPIPRRSQHTPRIRFTLLRIKWAATLFRWIIFILYIFIFIFRHAIVNAKKKKKNILLQNNVQFRELLDSSNWTRRYLLLISNTINEFFPSIPLSKFGRRQGEIAKIVTFFVVILYDSLSLSF